MESPDHWAELSMDYQTCRRGHHQSPIDLHSHDAIPIQQNLLIAYLPTHSHMLNNGHTVEFDMDEPNFIAVDDKRYQLIQLHFHADIEHKVDGVQFPAEMHLVHQSADGKLAVLAFLIEVGNKSDFGLITNKIPDSSEQRKVAIHFEKLIPNNVARYVYEGSLTTPPCTENVLWIVFKQHLHVRQEQLKSSRLIIRITSDQHSRLITGKSILHNNLPA